MSDQLFTIYLPHSDLVFTRYLYIKDEVRIALLLAILNKQDSAVFWAYELYDSGFQHELFALLWKIYYDFFATLNPSFETYFFKKHAEWIKTNSPLIIGAIVQDLLYRPFNTDIFFLQTITSSFQIDIDYQTNKTSKTNKISNLTEFHHNMEHWIAKSDYRSIAQWILCENTIINPIDIYQFVLDLFEKRGIKLTKSKVAFRIHAVRKEVVVLSKIMELFSKQKQLKKGRNLYFAFDGEELPSHDLKPRHILPAFAVHTIDESKFLGLFKLKRRHYDLKEKYWHHWEYHASFSPLWLDRIRKHRGYVDYCNEKVLFLNDDWHESFYESYGLEPDEQSKEVQERSIMEIEKDKNKDKNWLLFYSTYKKNGLVEVYEEELEELDTDGIGY